jgi:hypothetical protein
MKYSVILFITIFVFSVSARSFLQRKHETRSDELNTIENSNPPKYTLNVPIGKGI